jgi:hypothetical protein
MIGIYKGLTKEDMQAFYWPMFLLTVGFLIERYAINWLTNRSGLTYNKL